MAGQRIVLRTSTIQDGIRDSTGRCLLGIPMAIVTENGNVEQNDEWALFRLTDDGLSLYDVGAEFRMGIMSLRIGGERAVVELNPRYTTKAEANIAWQSLSESERARTLIRSVRPK